MLCARVAVPVPLGQAFTYSVPQALAPRVARGARVLCPFGRRKVLGVVLGVEEGAADVPEEKLKPLEAVVDAEPVLTEELLSFLCELASYYLAPVGEVMRLALPAVERRAAQALDAQGLLEGAQIRKVGRLVQVARVVPDRARPQKLGERAAAVLEALGAEGSLSIAELERRFGSVRSVVRRLVTLGLLEVEQATQAADPFFAAPAERDTPPELTDAQRHAVETVVTRLDAGEARSFLLHGVTASGKTEVYLQAVARCLELGGGAIVLVPEIALTPQLVGRFRARLGDSIAVYHSALTDGERHAMWTALRRGDLRVVVGARSALFAPVQRLRLVCVDEEHDPSFKQEEGVRYHARDMALLRAHRAGAICVLGSATPSLSAEALVRANKLERLRLPVRARSATLPRVQIVDLRRAGPGPGGERLLSLPLFRELERVLEAHEQAILFLNRRGFAPSLVCDDCGAVAQCPNCSVALTLHRTRGDTLVCHYCDFTSRRTERCADCKSDRLAREGAGTERIEAVLREILPKARVARLDRDVAAGLKSERVLERMRAGDIDILVGTQMVTKGHESTVRHARGSAQRRCSLVDAGLQRRGAHVPASGPGRRARGPRRESGDGAHPDTQPDASCHRNGSSPRCRGIRGTRARRPPPARLSAVSSDRARAPGRYRRRARREGGETPRRVCPAERAPGGRGGGPRAGTHRPRAKPLPLSFHVAVRRPP